MSDHLPFEIQAQIIKRLPPKSLIKFRPVSKMWKSLIDSSYFIARYRGQQQHLLVSYRDVYLKQNFVSVVDDDKLPHQIAFVTIPSLVNMFKYLEIIGSSYGLLCFYGCYEKGSRTHGTVIWNPSIRKAVTVIVPNVACVVGPYATKLGFGVCRETLDPKIVKVTYISWGTDVESVSCIPCQVEIFALSSGVWRGPYRNLPRKSIRFIEIPVAIDGCLYWLAQDMITMDGEDMSYNLIISFNITSEEFGEVNLPNSLASDKTCWKLSMYKVRESLVVLEKGNKLDLTIWMMEDGAPKSFTKLFTFNKPHAFGVRGFKKISEPIIEFVQDDYTGSLAIYEPHSKRIDNLGINGKYLTLLVSSYIETLLLLDHPDLIIYDKGERNMLKQAKIRRLSKDTRQ